ncbi:MAG TPA: YlxR family protein [Candidatus Dormibacteraeota bacterium]
MGCRAKMGQEELLRLRWDGAAVVVDSPGQRGPGRGAYVCAKMGCWETARKRRALGRALRLGGESIDQSGLAEVVVGMISGSPCRPGPTPATPS